jgi:hypothetical protein
MGIDDLGIATLRLGSYTNTMGDSASLKQACVGIHRRFYHIERLRSKKSSFFWDIVSRVSQPVLMGIRVLVLDSGEALFVRR